MCIICSALEAYSYVLTRNGYEYIITQTPGVMVEYRARMIGRERSRYGEPWYVSTSMWYEKGLPCCVNELDVDRGAGDYCYALYATGKSLNNIIKFNVPGLEVVELGSEDSNPEKCYIESGAFKNSSSSIKSLTLTSAIVSIGSAAFEGMTEGEIICERKSPPSLSSSAFCQKAYDNVILYVPDGCVDKYKQSTWKNFKKILPNSEYRVAFRFDPILYTVKSGESVRLTLSDKISNLTWSSSDENIVTVSDGVAKGRNPGRAIVTATHLSGSSAVCRITVIQPVSDLKFDLNQTELNNGTINVKIGDTRKIPVIILPTNASETQLTWESSNTQIAEVNQKGVITAKI